jgi:hypothetical protein
MILRTLLLLAATTAMASRVVAAPVHAPDRHVLHHCERVLAKADKATQPAKASRADATELDRCRMVIREFVSRESRMEVDEDGRRVR